MCKNCEKNNTQRAGRKSHHGIPLFIGHVCLGNSRETKSRVISIELKNGECREVTIPDLPVVNDNLDLIIQRMKAIIEKNEEIK